ncbi:MAG TPA: hypothetical protein VE008_02960 [Burkholderiales bacterium]|nr:hypothetical protein [Burkholderiales bacterium]
MIAVLGLVALVLWRAYSRMRRLIGRQRLSRLRSWISVCLFPVVVSLLAFVFSGDPYAVAALAAGAAVGAVLAGYGLRLTKFEKTEEGFFYTPSGHIGIALSLLLAGRILYRVVQLYFFAPTAGSPVEFAGSPLTLAIFGALAGYYVAYSAGLLRWQWRVNRGLAEARV